MKAEFDREVQFVANAMADFPFEDASHYCHWLNQHYFLVQHTSRYLALCASKVSVGDRNDFSHWVHHLREELDHDHALVLDMREMGHEQTTVALPEVQALIATQYYQIEKFGYETHYGYSLLLEGLAFRIGSELYKRVHAAHGVQARFIKSHSEFDQEHFPAGLSLIEKLPVETKKYVLENLRISSKLYVLILRAIQERLIAEQVKAAA